MSFLFIIYIQNQVTHAKDSELASVTVIKQYYEQFQKTSENQQND